MMLCFDVILLWMIYLVKYETGERQKFKQRTSQWYVIFLISIVRGIKLRYYY